MSSSLFNRVLLIVLTLAAISGWIAFWVAGSSDEPESNQAAVDLQQQLAQLQVEYDELQADHEGLLQETIALRTLSEERYETATDGDRESASINLIQAPIRWLPGSREHYLETRLDYASDQLRRLRAQLRQDEQQWNQPDSPSASEAELAAKLAEVQEKFDIERSYYDRAIEGLVNKLNQAVAIITDSAHPSTEQSADQRPSMDVAPKAESMATLTGQPNTGEHELGSAVNNAVTVDCENMAVVAGDREYRQKSVDVADGQGAEECSANELQMPAATASPGMTASAELLESSQFDSVRRDDAMRPTEDRVFLQNKNYELERQLSELQEALQSAADNKVDVQENNHEAVTRDRQLQNLQAENQRLQQGLQNADLRNQNMELMAQSIIEENQRLGNLIDDLRANMNLAIAEKFDEISKIHTSYAVIEYSTDILFESGSAELSEEGQQALAKFASTLDEQTIDNRIISVEGHTDNVPIAGDLTVLFPSNWELSTARAASATRFLVEQGVAAEFIRSVGFASMRPVATNDTTTGRAANRRIEIHLVPDFPPAGN